jgi:MSHA biogenesis protein MshL
LAVKNIDLTDISAQIKEPVYNIVVYDTPVKEVLFAMARDSKMNVDIHPAVQGRITLNAVDQTLPAILARISKQVDLSYKIENNVLLISPDQPELRTYRIDYVNMSRDTTGFIGAAAEISSTGQSATTGVGGNSTIVNTSGNGANNSSRTAVNSESRNKFWETLERNVKDILAETDKEIVITRLANPRLNKKSALSQTSPASSIENVLGQDESSRLQEEYMEFKTLYAATVIVNREAGVINVRATNKQHVRVEEFIKQVMESAKRQVLIEATIVEVRLNDSFQSGIDWSRLNNSISNSGFQFRQQLGPQTNNINTVGNKFSSTINALGSETGAGFVAGYLNLDSKIGNIAASIHLLEQFGSAKVLSSPKLMVLNNQTAVLKVVDNIVYFTVQSQQSQGSVGGVLSTVTTTANTVPVGVVMTVTPQVNAAGNVNINVRPTVSRVLGYKSDPNPNLKIESLVPEIQVREMESMLQILSGNTAILGGLMQDDVAAITDKVPGLANIPILGKLFTGKNTANSKTELVIFMRPTVIADASLANDSLSSYKKYLPASQLTPLK